MMCSRFARRTGVTAAASLAAFALVALCATGTAVAADRVVVAESFTNTGCGYCPYAGRALDSLMGTYPDSFFPIQCHVGDGYAFAWTSIRANFYDIPGTPTTWFDGVLGCEGAYTNDAQMISWYKTKVRTRLGVDTDVTVDVYGVETDTQTYEITAVVGIEEGGTAKEMIVHVVQVLDYYPSASDGRYRNCARDHLGESTVDLEPGESAVVTYTLVLDGADWTNKEDVKIVAFAQEPESSAPAEVYNAGAMCWPFVGPGVDGDVDGDGDVDLSDLAALLAAYGACEGDANYNADADFDDDGCITLTDLATLLSNYGYGS